MWSNQKMNVNTIYLSLFLGAAVVSIQPVLAQESPSVALRQEAFIDSVDNVRKAETKLQNGKQKDVDSKAMSDLKADRKESKRKAKDARRVEKEASNSLKASKDAYKAEKRAQKARRHANSEAEKAENAKEKSDKN
jgi:hypothetical protein